MVESYKYLGLVLTVFLDYSKTAKAVAKSANRALGLIIAKSKAFGGLPYDVLYKLYESLVCPVIRYGAPIWGTECFSCIQAVQNRAARYFLNVGKYTPVAAVNGDTAWYPMECRLWKVSKVAKIRNRCNQVPYLTQDTNGKVTNSQKTPQTRAKRSALSQQVTTKHI